MERIYRFALFSLFTIGFLGAVASADKGQVIDVSPKAIVNLVQDVKAAQEANAINNNTWTQDVSDINENGLSKVEELLSKGEQDFNSHATE